MCRATCFVLVSVWLCAVTAGMHAMATDRDQLPPNIVFILADDLAWSDLGCYGNRFMETPAIDRLAATGVRFTAAYTAPVCTPSRGMILSGQSSARTGLHKVPFQGNDRPWAKVIPPQPWGDRPVAAKPLGALLSEAGYVAKLVGKVHVPPPFTEGLDGTSSPETAQAALGDAFHQRLREFEQANREKQTGPITRQAIEFMASHRDRPFFCYVGHHAAHVIGGGPLDAREDLKRKYESKWHRRPAPIHPHYAAMCEVLDESVGLMLEALETLELSDRTLVVFTSDNGGVNRVFYDGKGPQITDLSPLRGEKGGLYEGGIRVPLIVHWPGHVRSGLVCDTPVIFTDFLPTFAEVAGIRLPQEQVVDGTSLLPLLQARVETIDRRIFIYFPDYHHDFPALAVRDGDFKLIESAEDGQLELYNLADDLGEAHNLAATMPDKADELRNALQQWRVSLNAPLPTPNPDYDPQRQHLLHPDAETARRGCLPTAWPPES